MKIIRIQLVSEINNKIFSCEKTIDIDMLNKLYGDEKNQIILDVIDELDTEMVRHEMIFF